MKPSGVQFAMPMRPPGRSTRSISRADASVVGREHHAEGRQHGVEAGIVERQRLGVGDLEAHGQAFGVRALAALLEQRRHVVGGGHVGKAARRGQRRVAVAGGDVEHALAGADVGGLGERLADDLQRRADDGEVAAGPGGLLALLDRREVRRTDGVVKNRIHGTLLK